MTTTQAAVWVIRTEDGQLGQWAGDSVLIFKTRKDAEKYLRRVVNRSSMRGQFSPAVLYGRSLDQIAGRPVSVCRDKDGTASYVILDLPRHDIHRAFDLAATALSAA